MSLTGTSKSTVTTMTNTAKSSATLYGITKAGQGWKYDELTITYDGDTDSEGRKVTYDGVGSTITLTPLTKNNV